MKQNSKTYLISMPVMIWRESREINHQTTYVPSGMVMTIGVR